MLFCEIMSNLKKPPESREPTIDELVAFMHANEIPFWKSGDGRPEQREQFLEGIKARWRAAQKTTASDSTSDSSENFDTSGWSPQALKWLEEQRQAGKTFRNADEADAAYIASHRPPFPNPTEEQLRRDRITQAYLSGQRPDPEDLAEEETDKIRYQRKVAEGFERKAKELSEIKPPESPTQSKKKPARMDGTRGGNKRRPSANAASKPKPIDRWLWALGGVMSILLFSIC